MRQTNEELVVQLRRLVDDQEGGDAVVLVQRQLFNRVVGRLAAKIDDGNRHHEAKADRMGINKAQLAEKQPELEAQGLYRKFEIHRVDGSDRPGGKHHGCAYFVLDLDHDQYAGEALAAYASACEGSHPELARDIRKMLA